MMMHRTSFFRLSSAAVGLVLLLAGCAAQNGSTPNGGPEEDPVGGGEPTVSLATQQGPTGSDVQITASGFQPDTAVEIGFGPPQSEYEVISQAQTDAQGRLTTTVEVPSWAENGRPYVFVVAERDNQPKAISGRFTVTSGS